MSNITVLSPIPSVELLSYVGENSDSFLQKDNPDMMLEAALGLFSKLGLVIEFLPTSRVTGFLGVKKFVHCADFPEVVEANKGINLEGIYVTQNLEPYEYNQLYLIIKSLDFPECFRSFLEPIFVNTNSSSPIKIAAALQRRQAVGKFGKRNERKESYIARDICNIPNEKLHLARKIIPPYEAFSSVFHDIDFTEIIRYLPPAELEIFKLVIGRALYGTSGFTHVDSEVAIKHAFRIIPLVFGEPKIGKSEVLKTITNAMNDCGYNSMETGNLQDRFCMANRLSSDLLTNDDLNEKSLKNLLEAEITKKIATGARVLTEEKGVSIEETDITTTLICNVNKFSESAIYNSDEGMIDRLRVLQCYRRVECENRGHNMDINPWQKLAKEKNVTELSIAKWFLRHCFDLFEKEVINKTLDDTVRNLTRQLRTRITKNTQQDTAGLVILSYCLFNDISPREIDNYLVAKTTMEAMFWFCQIVNNPDYSFIRNLVKRYYDEKVFTKNSHDYDKVISELDKGKILEILNSHKELTLSSNVIDTKTVFDKMVGKLSLLGATHSLYDKVERFSIFWLEATEQAELEMLHLWILKQLRKDTELSDKIQQLKLSLT